MSDSCVESDDLVRRTLGGIFEYFVNTDSSPSNNSKHNKLVINAVNNVVCKYGMNPQWAGSIKKSTNVTGYSDGDIWIESYGKQVSEQTRMKIGEEILLELKSIFNKVDGPKYKPVALEISVSQLPISYSYYGAISYTTDEYDFDIIFSNGSWTNPNPVAPDNSYFKSQFHRQRATKALKLLSKHNELMFPRISGLRLERLVLYSSIDVEKHHRSNPEYNSGLLLFRTCLYQFIFSETGTLLAKKISDAKGLPILSDNDVWKIDNRVFDSWRSSAAILLATIHEIRTDSNSSSIFRSHNNNNNNNNVFVNKDVFISALKGQMNYNRGVKLDDHNRIVFN